MSSESICSDGDLELFLAKMKGATKPEASKTEFTDSATEAAMLRGAARYVLISTDLNHRNEGHSGSSSEDCAEKKCVDGVEAAATFIEMAQRTVH